MKKILSLLLVVVMMLGMLPVSAFAAGTTPSKDANAVYQIGPADELLWFAQEVNAGKTTLKAALTANIDLSSVTNWPGIGSSDCRFAGSFDGKNHTVTFQNASVGLFGYVQGTSSTLATIKNVKTKGSINDSGIAHEASFAVIENCVNGATITAGYTSRVGGIVGVSQGVPQGNGTYANNLQITKCGNEASVSGGASIGGIVGFAKVNTKLNNCYNTGNINGAEDVGGLAGYLQSSFSGETTVTYGYNTGTITGATNVGGIVGHQLNGVKISYCVNIGNATYAIAGAVYNNTATIKNCFFLGTASSKPNPDLTYYTQEELPVENRATAKSAQEMSSADFANALGSTFKQSCPAPVFSWQTASGHSGSPCTKCNNGSTTKEVYNVSFQQSDGFVLSGAATVTQGASYSFTLSINDGYKKDAAFAVKVNGIAVDAASDGKYTVTNVRGPLSITVFDVVVIPGSYSISLPGEGYGYRVTGDKTVPVDASYSFQVNFVDGFKKGSNFKVVAQQVLTQAQINKGITPKETEVKEKNGRYTISKVEYNCRILVSGVEAVSKINPVTVDLRVTEGYNNFHTAKEGKLMNATIKVPYFDLSLYDLEKYYYNPYCYKDEKGNIRNVQQKGTPESAYDKITIMHAFIVATEIYYLGYSQNEVGKGLSYKNDPNGFKKAISWSQDAGSSFMDFWDHGTNLNYYLNYEYPLAYAGWGSTSDQILLKNGDMITIHMITGQGSGAQFGFFTVNDTNKKYNKGTDVINSYTVDQGEKLDLTLYWTSTTGSYATKYNLQKNKQLYWIKAGSETMDVSRWKTSAFGKTTSLVTDANGTVTINTAGLEPGTYYIGALGGFTGGGDKDDAGFVSTGAEAGPSVFKLTVNAYDGKPGDVNGDTVIDAKDATVVLRVAAKLETNVNSGVADVNGDGLVDAKDATLILRYAAKLIDTFPVKS